ADNVDPNLVNAWGLAAGPTSPWWVSDNGSDRSTLYNPAGTPLRLVVSVPGAPTGTVFNATPGSFLVGASNASFIFSTEAGTILGWNGGPAATVEADRSPAGAVYKGLAIAPTPAGPRIYATDFHNGAVDVFDPPGSPCHTLASWIRSCRVTSPPSGSRRSATGSSSPTPSSKPAATTRPMAAAWASSMR
ncbi:TIGR03118 family protein, partial [Solirubrobacter ginsenosidimutans]